LAVNLPWALALLALAIVACRIILVAPEEQYLAARFGEKYRAYSASVHRWWGRARRSM
jgi:protein-S-isoprenylcysteine O-methyltransferase Ste14